MCFQVRISSESEKKGHVWLRWTSDKQAERALPVACQSMASGSGCCFGFSGLGELCSLLETWSHIGKEEPDEGISPCFPVLFLLM